MKHLVFDLETTAIDKADPTSVPGTIHCIVTMDVGTEEMLSFGPDEIAEGLVHLASANRLIGHNIAGFDIPVIEKWCKSRRRNWRTPELYDTYLASRLIFASNLYSRDVKARNTVARCGRPRRIPGKPPRDCGNCPGCVTREIRLPAKYMKRHSLDAWGQRLGEKKIKYTGGWDSFSNDMLVYCQQDVRTNLKLYRYLKSAAAERGWPLCSDRSILNESKCGYIIGLQERNGVGFDMPAAHALQDELIRKRSSLTIRLRKFFPPWIRPVAAEHTPKRTMTRRKGLEWPVTYVEGAPFIKIELAEFNPDSKHDIADRLQTIFGWKPRDRTPKTNEPIVDEKTLMALPYPCIPDLIEYMTVAKRLGQLADGREGWLNHVVNGRIHGRVHVTGTRTSRMSHFKPNMNVPKNKSPYGKECRGLFIPTRPGWVMVGADASRLELMMLAHRLARFDGGEFGHKLSEGDPHSEWQRATGMFERENQKTFTYAMLYGAGSFKLGCIVLEDWWEAFRNGKTDKQPPGLRHAASLGSARKRRLLKKVPALDALLTKCSEAYRRGYVIALDGRVLGCKAEHGVLNDVLQSDGEIVMKHALTLSHDELTEKFGQHGEHWAYMLNIHDEVQFEAEPAIAESVGEAFVGCITAAAESLKVRVPVTGAYKVGKSWMETH